MRVPVNVSAVSDLRNEALLTPSSKSASNPEPEPSLAVFHIFAQELKLVLLLLRLLLQ